MNDTTQTEISLNITERKYSLQSISIYVFNILKTTTKYIILTAIRIGYTIQGLKPIFKNIYDSGKTNRKKELPYNIVFFNLPTACIADHNGLFRESINMYMSTHRIKIAE